MFILPFFTFNFLINNLLGKYLNRLDVKREFAPEVMYSIAGKGWGAFTTLKMIYRQKTERKVSFASGAKLFFLWINGMWFFIYDTMNFSSFEFDWKMLLRMFFLLHYLLCFRSFFCDLFLFNVKWKQRKKLKERSTLNGLFVWWIYESGSVEVRNEELNKWRYFCWFC